MKRIHRLLAVLLVMLLAIPFTSCDKALELLVDPSATEVDTNSDTVEDAVDNTEDETLEPYTLVFKSNNDGTCSVSIKTNINYTEKYYTEKYTVTIPEKSPDGDTVTEIASSGFTATANVPTIIIPEVYEKLINEMNEKVKTLDETEEKKAAFEVMKFESYYTKYDISAIPNESQKQNFIEKYPVLAATPIYVCDPTASLEEYKILSDTITQYSDFTAIDNYNASSELIALAEKAGIEEHKIVLPSISNNITAIELPDTVKTISDNAFINCISITSLNIPASVTSIGNFAFAECNGITSITIPNSVKSIGNNVFEYCTNLTSVTISGSVTSIGDCAFKDCNNLANVVISEGVTSIGGYAFDGCSSLTSIIIPDSVMSMGSHVFVNCPAITAYCEASAKPDGWDENWASSNGLEYFSIKVEWGYKG